jgi:hypothetical protein
MRLRQRVTQSATLATRPSIIGLPMKAFPSRPCPDAFLKGHRIECWDYWTFFNGRPITPASLRRAIRSTACRPRFGKSSRVRDEQSGYNLSAHPTATRGRSQTAFGQAPLADASSSTANSSWWEASSTPFRRLARPSPRVMSVCMSTSDMPLRSHLMSARALFKDKETSAWDTSLPRQIVLRVDSTTHVVHSSLTTGPSIPRFAVSPKL